MKYLWVFIFLFSQLAWSVTDILKNEEDHLYLHYCRYPHSSQSKLTPSSTPIQQQACADVNMVSTEPFSHPCLDEKGDIFEIVHIDTTNNILQNTSFLKEV